MRRTSQAGADAARRLPAALHAADAAQPSKPDLVLIFIDDLGYGDIGPFGPTKQKTPVTVAPLSISGGSAAGVDQQSLVAVDGLRVLP